MNILIPPMIILVALGVAIGYIIGYVDTTPENEMALILSIIGVGLAIAIFVIQQDQSKKLSQQTTQVEELIEKVNSMTTKFHEKREERKNIHEALLVHALVEIKHQGRLMNEEILQGMKTGTFSMNQISEKWSWISSIERLEHLIYTGFDIVESIVLEECDKIKQGLKIELSDEPLMASSNLGMIESVINKLLKNELNDARKKIIKMTEGDIRNSINKYQEQNIDEKSYQPGITFREIQLKKYRL